MAIKIKKSQNVSQSYYKLDDRALSNGTEAGSKSKSKSNSDLFKKITKYSHNILKSTKNLTFDIIGTQVPNLKDIKEQIVEVATETTEESRKTIGELVAFGKKTFASGSEKSIKDKTKDILKNQKDDILKRLKSGKIYMSDSEKQEEQFSKEFGDFDFSGDDFDTGDMSDSFMSTSENDTLPDEPFSTPVRKGTVHYINVSAERRQRLAKSNVKRGGSSRKSTSSGGSSHMGELRLGDELISETASQIGQSLIEQNEELWARSFAAEENRFGKLIGYQSTIVSSLNNIVEFNTSVVGENIKAQMEYQAKAMAAQEDMLALTKELKDAIIAVGTYKPTEFKDRNLLNGNRLNAKEYSNVIKSNIGDLLSSKGLGGLGMMMGMIPMLTENGEMMKGTFDPINSILKFAGNSLLSTKTRAKAFQLNRKLGNFGASFLNRMNELSQYGTGFGQVLGSILGDRSTKITQANLGLSNPNAVVGWTSKSDATLNTVIPMYLSKILAATTGGDEIHWDYKSGRFNTKSAMRQEYESKRALAYTNATITSYSTDMINRAQSRGQFKDNQREGVEKAIEKINQNIVKSKLPVRLNRLQTDADYREMLLNGVDKKYAGLAMGVFIEGFKSMSSSERETLNGIGYGTAGRNVQKNLNKISRDALDYGGAGALSEFSLEYEIAERAEEINRSKKYDISGKSFNELSDYAKTQRSFARAEAIMQLARMLPSVDDPKSIKAVEDLIKKEFNTDDIKDIDVNDLMKKAQDLKQKSSVKSFEQKMRMQILSMNLPGLFFGNRFEGNFVDKSMGGIFDFLNGTYSNFMGDNEIGGEGLRENSDIEHLLRATNDQSRQTLTNLYIKLANAIYLGNGKLKSKALNEIAKVSANLSASEKSLDTGGGNNPWEFENYNQIDNDFLHDVAGKGLNFWNKNIYDTGIEINNNNKITDNFNINAAIKFIEGKPELKTWMIKTRRYKKYLLGSVYYDSKELWKLFERHVKHDPKLQKKLAKDILDWLNTEDGQKFMATSNAAKKMSIIFKSKGNKSEGPQHFATGGIVNGVDTGEDKVDAKLRPGEMVLTKEQQKKLYEISNSGGKSFQSSLDKLGITYNDVSSSIKELGVVDTLKLYSEQIQRNKYVKTFITRVGKFIGSPKFQGYGDVISLGGIRRGISNGLGAVGAVAGGIAGSAFGHPLLGAGLVGGAVKGLSSLFNMKYPKLKGSLLAAGYADAVRMNKTDLYALITSMALSRSPYEREKGKALMETNEFKDLDKRVNNKNAWDKFVDGIKATPKFIKNRARDIKLILHRTIKYKDVVNALDSRFTDYGVTSYDKEALYAMALSLPENTESDKQFKNAIMGMKGYKKRARDGDNYMTLADHIREGVKDIPKKFIRAYRYGKLFKYRNLARIYINAMGISEKEFLNDDKTSKDPSLLYAALLSFKNNEDANKRAIYRVLSKQKSFMQLEIANARITGKSEKEIEDIKGKYKDRKRFSALITILKNAYNGKPENMPDYDNMEPTLLYACVNTLVEKGDKRGKAIASSGQYKLLQTTVNGKIGKSKDSINLGDSSDWSDMSDDDLSQMSGLKNLMSGLRKKGIRGKEAGKAIDQANAAFADSKNLKNSNIINGGADQAAKKAIIKAGPMAGMISLLSSMNRTMASTLKVLGGNDKGEIDENNTETIAGQLGLSSGSGSGNDKKKKVGFNFFSAAAGIMAALAARSAIKKGQRIKADGLEGLFEKESSTAFNADGSKKNFIQRALDRGGDASNRAIVQSVVQKFGMTAAEKAAGKSVGGFAAVVKRATTKKVTKEATDKGMDLLIKNLKGIEDTLIKFIQDPKILKKLPKAALKGIKKLPSFLKEIPKRILNFAKNGIKNGVKSASSALKAVPTAGWIIAIASVVWDVANALNDAPRYFHVAPKDVTAGMRATAGIVGGIKSLIVNLLSITGIGPIIGVAIDVIIPTGWLVEKIYGLIASDTAKQELAEKQQKQKDVAQQLGVDTDKLTEAQNNSLLSKMGSGIHAAFSSKTYAEIQEEKTLKKLNKGRTEGNKISAEEYRNATGTGDIVKKIKGLKGNSSSDSYNEVASTFGSALSAGDSTAVEQMVKAAKEKDKNVPFLTSDTSTLTSSFRAKWEKLINDPEIVAAGIKPVISGTRRTLATQMALYSKGRGDRSSIDKAVKAAGQSSGANFWSNIDDPVTWTLKSNHLGGNALDINTSNLSSDQLALLGKVAAKYGIVWGGNWDDAHKDYPHFEDAKPTQYLARGGLIGGRLGSWGDKVRARLNPGEMVLNRVQQTALFNKIKSYEQDLGMSGLSAVGKLKESPLLTNARMDVKMIQEAINIQQAIYVEQKRHNDVAEKFFNAILKLMSGSKPTPAIIQNDNEDISELLRGAATIANGF